MRLCLVPHRTHQVALQKVLGTVMLSLLQLEPRVSGASNARSDWGFDEHTLGTS